MLNSRLAVRDPPIEALLSKGATRWGVAGMAGRLELIDVRIDLKLGS